MGCLTAERRRYLQEKLEKKERLLAQLYIAYENFDNVEQYKFQTAEAMQQTKYRDIKEVQDMIDRLEAQIERIKRQLNGTGLNNIVLRRY